MEGADLCPIRLRCATSIGSGPGLASYTQVPVLLLAFILSSNLIDHRRMRSGALLRTIYSSIRLLPHRIMSGACIGWARTTTF